MDIKYTYMDEKRPIQKAEFKTKTGTFCLIETQGEIVGILMPHSAFNKPDLAGLITLLQRFYKQMPEVE